MQPILTCLRHLSTGQALAVMCEHLQGNISLVKRQEMLQKFAKLKADSEGIDRIIYTLIRVMLFTDVYEAERELAHAKELLGLEDPRQVRDSSKHRLILQNLCCMIEYMSYHEKFMSHFFGILKVLLQYFNGTKAAWKARYLSSFGSGYLKWATKHIDSVSIDQVKDVTTSLQEEISKLTNHPQIRFLQKNTLLYETSIFFNNKGAADDCRKSLENIIENFSKSFRFSKPLFYYCLIGDCYLDLYRMTKRSDKRELYKEKGGEAYQNALDRSPNTPFKENELKGFKSKRSITRSIIKKKNDLINKIK